MIKRNFMKKYILLVFLLFSAIGYTVGQTSQNSGEWSQNQTWVGTAPGYILPGNNQTDITIVVGHTVHTIEGQGLTFSGNRGNLTIRGTLIINGDLIITGNNWEINVEEGGEFIVNGNVQFDQPAQSDQASPDLTINGVATINGNLTGTGNLLGNGELYMNDGQISTNINVQIFNGNIVYGVTDLSLPAPTDLDGYELAGPKVFLEWEFDDSGIPDGTELIGFQVFRNNNRPTVPTYNAFVIQIFPFDDDIWYTTSVGELQFEDTDLQFGNEPKYYIRAIYIRNSEIVFSEISNVIDFLNQPLPIELLSFYARALDYAIGLYWSTAVEINNMGFEIQRLDVKTGNWVVIGWVDGNYNHNGVLNYSYTDFNPQEGVNYYRLRQIDYDGVYEFYGPVAAAMDTPAGAFDLKVVRSHNQVFVIMPGNETGLLEVFDLAGKRILAQYASGSITMPMARGTYIIRFSGSYQTATAKVVL
jgi:hypothetical protein